MDGVMLKKAFIGATQFLETNKEEVNALNVFPVPDGDTGTNMSLTMKSAIKQVLSIEEYSAGKVAVAASNGSLMGARGNSGVILSQLFRGFATGLKDKETVSTMDLADALKLASDTAYKAVMKPTEGTILTVARGCAEYALKIAEDENDIITFMRMVIEHGNYVLGKTPEMLPVLKQAGVVDAGGKGLMCVLTGAYNAVTTGEEIKLEFLEPSAVEEVHVSRDIDTADIKYGYCTEFMINTSYDDYEQFREEISVFGDSLMVVGGEGLIKVHIHTNNPGDVLEKALTLGELNDIKIDNMRYQHSHIIANEDNGKNKKAKKPTKKYSLITVSIGEGINTVFNELNVDYIIPGGQTMNPSTEDLLNAIEEVEGENIIILPNNGNIVLAAEQAKELSDKKVYVFPTKTIPEGISALISFNPELDVDENLENMKDAISYVKTAQVTYAVRDTEINDTKIKKDDIIGITGDEILSIGNDVDQVAFELLEKIVEDESSLITIFYGNGLEEKTALELSKKVEETFEDFDVEVVFGGQPLYYYIFSIE
jgi:DAK2 domain fusion protein YloV